MRDQQAGRDIWSLSMKEREALWLDYAALCAQAAWSQIIVWLASARYSDRASLILASDGRWQISTFQSFLSDPIMVAELKPYLDRDALYKELISSRNWLTRDEC